MHEEPHKSGVPTPSSQRGAADLSPQELAERRAWHLAFLLLQDEDRATSVVVDLVRSRPDLVSLALPMRDRLVIQHLREPARTANAPRRMNDSSAASGPTNTNPPPAPVLAGMSPQAREAFVLGRIDAVDPLWMAQAMDCSKTAARVHLQAAEESYRTAKVDPQVEIEVLDRRVLGTKGDRIGAIVARERESRKRLRRRRAIIALGLAFIVLSVALLAFLQWAQPGMAP
jgi:hypothetical protein